LETALPISCGDLQKLDADGHRRDVVTDAKVCDSEHVAKVTTPVKQCFSCIRELTTKSKNDNNHPKHASEPSLQAYIEAIGAITPSITDDSDGKSSSAGKQRPPSPTDSVKTLEGDYHGSPCRHVKPCGNAADPFNAIDNFDFNPSCALTGLKKFCCRQPSIPQETPTKKLE